METTNGKEFGWAGIEKFLNLYEQLPIKWCHPPHLEEVDHFGVDQRKNPLGCENVRQEGIHHLEPFGWCPKLSSSGADSEMRVMRTWLIKEVLPKEMGKDGDEARQGKEGNQARIMK